MNGKKLSVSNAKGLSSLRRRVTTRARPVKYVADAKNPRDRMAYNVIVNKLKKGEPIKKIAEDTDVTRDTVYRIKKEVSSV